MNNAQTQTGATAALAVEQTKLLLGRYLAGFSDETVTAQAPSLPNHVAWNLGHLALTMHRVSEKFDGQEPPHSDFVAGKQGNSTAIAIEAVSFGSNPESDGGTFPSLQRCIDIYNASCDRLGANLRSATAAKLAEQVPWGNGTTSLEALALRMAFHNGFHTGQIADLRRALKMKSIFAKE